jgi:hypothetical protein
MDVTALSDRKSPLAPPRRFSRALMVFASLVAFAIVIEVGLRMALGLGSPVLFEADARFGAYPKANQHLHRFFVDISTNQYGMRSPQVGIKQPGEYRILFVGDSVAFGTTLVNQRDTLVERIGERLKVTVLNAASPGWAPANELGFLKARGLYDADMVVMVYNTKDLSQTLSAYRESPAAPLSNPPLAIGELWERYILPRILPKLAVVDNGSTSADDKPTPEARAQVLDTIEETRRFVVSQGKRFSILFSPAVTADVHHYQSEWDGAVNDLRVWALHKDVPITDMTQSVAAGDAELLYFDGIHLRPAGDRLFADIFVKQYGEIPPQLARNALSLPRTEVTSRQ